MNNNKQLTETLKVPLTILSFRRRSKFPKLHQKIIQKQIFMYFKKVRHKLNHNPSQYSQFSGFSLLAGLPPLKICSFS